MKQPFFIALSAALLLSALVFTSCQKEDVKTVSENQLTIDESNYYTPDLSDFEVDLTNRAYWTTIPAGSTDMLQQAVDNADPGGIIYLKAEMHQETERVTIRSLGKMGRYCLCRVPIP